MAKQPKQPSRRDVFLAGIYAAYVDVAEAQGSIVDTLRSFAAEVLTADQDADYWKDLRGDMQAQLESVKRFSEGTCKTRASQMGTWLKNYATNAFHKEGSDKQTVGVHFREFQKDYADYQRCLNDWNKKKDAKPKAAAPTVPQAEQESEKASDEVQTVEVNRGTALATFVLAVEQAELSGESVFDWAAANVKEALQAWAEYVAAKQAEKEASALPKAA